MQQQASAAVHTAIGAVAGVVEVTIMQPTVAIKNALQVSRLERERERRFTVFFFFFFFFFLISFVDLDPGFAKNADCASCFPFPFPFRFFFFTQAGRPIPWSPPELYRGYVVRFFQNFVFKKREGERERDRGKKEGRKRREREARPST